MKLNLFKLFVLLGWPFMAAAQDNVNMKFGKPTQEEMLMTVYEAEPDAEAVVLCRLTDVEYTVQFSSYLVDYHERCRIKVLKPGGVRFAKVVVPYQMSVSPFSNVGGLKNSFLALPIEQGQAQSYFEGETGSMTESIFDTEGDESVESVKATAFNMVGNKVVKTTLKKSDISKRKIDEHNYVVEFTVPDVRKGTVIEYEYTVHSQVFWELRDWYAQGEMPVVFAKLDMNIPNYLIFNIEDHGIQRLTYTCTVGSMKYKLESDPLAAPMTVNTNHYVYTGRNLNGIPKAESGWNYLDLCAGIVAELKTYRLRGMMPMDYARTWEQIDAMILDSDELGRRLNDHSPLIDELKEAGIDKMADARERTAAVYRLVTGAVNWDGRYKLSPGPAFETLSKRRGTNADINLLLIQSLRDAGLTAAPVVLRTRDQGMLPYNFPSIRKLSTFVVAVILPGGGRIYLDASSKDGRWDVLPDVLLVERARLVRKDGKSEWVNLQKVFQPQKE